MTIGKLVALLAASLFSSLSVAHAAVITVNEPACGGFSTCDDSSFVSFVGGPLDEFIDFTTDTGGNPVLGSPIAGSIFPAVAGNTFSTLVTFSSAVGTFGGIASSNVNIANATSPSAEIGPLNDFDGILVIDFLTPVSAVGFGTVEFEPNETISVFDPSNNLLATFSGVSNDIFDYVGIVATAGEEISRVELDGAFFAIQNIQFNQATTSVPEPEGIAMLGLGLTLLGLWSRRQRSRRAQNRP